MLELHPSYCTILPERTRNIPVVVSIFEIQMELMLANELCRWAFATYTGQQSYQEEGQRSVWGILFKIASRYSEFSCVYPSRCRKLFSKDPPFGHLFSASPSRSSFLRLF